MDTQFSGFEIFAPKVEVARTALQRQCADRLTGAEVDHLSACLVYGVTSPAYAEREPALQFDICCALVAVRSGLSGFQHAGKARAKQHQI
jgi:hypothetical protein